MVRLLPIFVVAAFGLRFAYICAMFRVLRDSGDAVAEASPKAYFPIFSFGLWGLYLFGTAYWGIAGNPYRQGQTLDGYIQNADDAAMWLIIVLAGAVILSFVALYQSGEWAAMYRRTKSETK
jgi:hypothetical protein